MVKVNKKHDVTIVGGGLAGCEAAWQLATRGFSVLLIEMRPHTMTPAHTGDALAELVCSNSLKAEALDTGNGLLKSEMRKFGSLILSAADLSRVPAGGAMAVDRDVFAAEIARLIASQPNITVERREVLDIPVERPCIIASGPLTSDTLAERLKEYCGGGLHFFDAISPIIDADSINYDVAYFKGRYDKGGDDYCNLPMTEEQYNAFYDALMAAEKVQFKDFEKLNVYEGCMPVEEMASRGRQTLTFGPMKPVGLEDPKTGRTPYAVVQLRKENVEGTSFNIVGFQTKMKIGEQQRVFRMIPGLENADFLRYGSIHRNTYIDGPANLDRHFRHRKDPMLFFAGQVTGVEGYMESTASGMMAGLALARMLAGKEPVEFPLETALGSLARYVCGESGAPHAVPGDYVPSNFHFGMLPPIPGKKIKDKRQKKTLLSERALAAMENLVTSLGDFTAGGAGNGTATGD